MPDARARTSERRGNIKSGMRVRELRGGWRGFLIGEELLDPLPYGEAEHYPYH